MPTTQSASSIGFSAVVRTLAIVATAVGAATAADWTNPVLDK